MINKAININYVFLKSTMSENLESKIRKCVDWNKKNSEP